eukprot:721127-Karenia_brevis.AAC.1
MDEDQLWYLSNKWLTDPVPMTPGIDSKQVKRQGISKSPLPQTSKVPESAPRTLEPAVGKEV